MKSARGFILMVALVLATVAAQAEPIVIPSTDGQILRTHWFPRAAAQRAPAVVALHGCSGLYRRDGVSFDPRYPEYIARLHAAGFHVLLPDSFGTRGSGPICAQRSGERTVTVEMRRADAIAAVRWLAARTDVDAARIVMLGWSNGGTTTLAAINAARAAVARPLAGAVVFYPGCAASLKRPFALGTPLLMLLGEKDDWTPAAQCVELAARTQRAQPEAELTVRVYAGSHHGFDGSRPVRFRDDISSGVDRSGVHVGGNPVARVAALAELDAFLARVTSAAAAR